MRCSLFAVVLIAISLLLIGLLPRVDADSPQQAARLPGARNMIDASQYPSIQAALDAVPDEGGIVVLPPGEFQLSEPLRLSREDVLIRGSGTATHIRNANEQGEPALVIQPPEGTRSLWRIKLADFRITGNAKSGDGIVARRIDEFFLDGVTISNHGGHGVFLDHCYEDPRVCDSLITYNKKTGLALAGCHDIVVVGNQFEENLDAVTCTDGFNLCMTGNNLDDHLRHGVVIENTYGSVVSGNMIEECQGAAVVLERDCYGITVSANVIAHNFGGGVDLRDAHGCTVSANTFTIVPSRAVAVGEQSGRITITGNSFSDSFTGESEKRKPGDQAASGIVLEATHDVAVSGNSFSGLDSEAVQQTGQSQRVLFVGNVLTDVDHSLKSLDESHVADNLPSESGKEP